jgi:hypothetical protein
MLVQFGNVWLTNDGTGALPERAITSTIGAKLNGEEVIQEARFLRAAAATYFDRGNLGQTFTFKVTRNFQLLMPGANNPIAQAGAFALLHGTLLPRSATLLLVCGGWGEPPLYVKSALPAVLKTPECQPRGVGVDVTYTFRFGALVAAQPLTDSSGGGLTDSTGQPILD